MGSSSAPPVIGGHRAPSGDIGGNSALPVIGGHRSPTVVDADPENRSTRVNTPIGASLTSREWAELVEEVTRRIEGRVVAEMSRRGRRNVPRPM